MRGSDIFRLASAAGILLSASTLAGCSVSSSGPGTAPADPSSADAAAPVNSTVAAAPSIADATVPAEPVRAPPNSAPATGCPAGMLEVVQARINASAAYLPSFAGVTVSLGTLNDVKPSSLRPLLTDACITKYTSKTGAEYTYVFSRNASQQEIDDAVKSSGYTGSMSAPASQYEMPTSGKAPATVTVSGTSKDKDFAAFFPTGLAVQTAVPAGAASSIN